MRPDERDAAYLWDMMEAARSVLEFTNGIVYEQYLSDKMRQRAVERSVEIIGEAARRLSEPFKEAHPDIPWRRIVQQRNVLAHEYDDIKHEFIWVVARERVPELIAQLSAIAPSVESPSNGE